MLIGIVLTVFGGLLVFGVFYDAVARKSFKAENRMDYQGAYANQHIDNAHVDGAANHMSRESSGF